MTIKWALPASLASAVLGISLSALGHVNQLELYADIPTESTVAQTQSAINTLIASAKDNGIRRIIPSLNRADASVMWQTTLELYDTERTSHLQQGFDALDYFIDRAHANGIEVYPSLAVSMAGRIVESDLHNHPWLSRNRDLVVGSYADNWQTHALSFAYSGARAAKIDQIMDLVNGYDVDGLFIDYARYQENYGYDQPTIDHIMNTYGFNPATDPQAAPPNSPWLDGSTKYVQFATERMATVRDFVVELGNAVAASSNPNVRIGTFADHRKGMKLDTIHRGRNFPEWAQNGLVADVFLGNYDEPILDDNNSGTEVIGIRRSLQETRNAVGPNVTLYGSLSRSTGVSLSTQDQFFDAAAESLIGGADHLFVYQGAGLNVSSWEMLRKTSVKVEKLNYFHTVSTQEKEYDASEAAGLPSSVGWGQGGSQMQHVPGPNGSIRQSGANATGWYQSPVTSGLMTDTDAEYAVEFKIRPLDDLTANNTNLRNLHVMWADDDDSFNLLIDRDSNDGASGTLGSVRYGWSTLIPAISEINWSSPHTILVQYHADNDTFYFFLDDQLMNYVDASELRVGNHDGFPDLPDLRNRVLFGDSATGGTGVSADWYFVRAYSINAMPEPSAVVGLVACAMLHRPRTQLRKCSNGQTGR